MMISHDILTFLGGSFVFLRTSRELSSLRWSPLHLWRRSEWHFPLGIGSPVVNFPVPSQALVFFLTGEIPS